MNHRRTHCWIRAAVLVVGGLLTVSAPAQNEEEALRAVRAELEALERRLARQQEQRDAGYEALRRVELEVAAATAELAALRRRREAQLERRDALLRQTSAATERLEDERTALAEQLQLSYMTGREELFKLLLSQQSPAQLGRMLVYYGYFNRARAERIAAVVAELDNLARLRRESEQVADELAELETAQQRQLQALAASRDRRQAVVAELEASVSEAGRRVERLRADERRLTDLLAELEAVMAALPAGAEAPFTQARGGLSWPVDGRRVGDFGAARNGTMRWNGVMLESTAGRPVRAVYHGRVAFADWLPGLGLLIIVDHGEGYMSLYGHNGALLKEPGDWVAPGEPIAQVGDTGGQAQPGLYFEIRRNGEAIDPGPWMQPAGGR